MKNFLSKDFGFSLVETMLSVGLLSAIGLGAVYISKGQNQTKTTLTAKNDVEQTVQAFEVKFSETTACGSLLKDVAPGSALQELKEANGNSFLKVGDKTQGGFHTLRNINVGALDPLTKTVRIGFSFSGDKKGSQNVTKFVTVTPVMTGGNITGCIDPFALASDAALKKMCMDVDPLKIGDCTLTLSHLMAEIKELYCKNHPLFDYDPVAKKCLPLDANKSCNSNFVQGYDSQGKLVCVPHNTDPDVPPRGSTTGCNSWSEWSPAANTTCNTSTVSQSRTCTSGSGSPQSRTVPGTMNCACTQWSAWAPAQSSTCFGQNLTQTRTCTESGKTGTETQTVKGTKTDGSCAAKCPAVPQQDWTQVTGAVTANCSAPLSEGSDGAVLTITDSSAPTTGSASFQCANGSWKPQGPGSCIKAPSPGSCSCNISAMFMDRYCASGNSSAIAPPANYSCSPNATTKEQCEALTGCETGVQCDFDPMEVTNGRGGVQSYTTTCRWIEDDGDPNCYWRGDKQICR